MQTLQQGTSSCFEFLQLAKSCTNQLAASGKPVEDDDLISYVIGELNSSYHNFISLYSFSTREIGLSYDQFQTELLNHEILLVNSRKSTEHEIGGFALYSQKPKNQQFHKNKILWSCKTNFCGDIFSAERSQQ